MFFPPSPAHDTSADLEKAALQRFQSLMGCLPAECLISRDIWGNSTVLCLDLGSCPDQLEAVMQHSFLLLVGANYLGLAQSILFRVGPSVKGWKTMVPVETC